MKVMNYSFIGEFSGLKGEQDSMTHLKQIKQTMMTRDLIHGLTGLHAQK